MKTLVCVALLLQLCVFAAAAGSGDASADASLSAAPGRLVLLPCNTTGGATPSLTAWTKNGREVIRSGGSTPGTPGGSSAADPQRLTVLESGSLRIAAAAPGDEGSYLCNATLPGGAVVQARVQLQVTSGPENVSTSIGPAITLPNGTLAAVRGSSVHLNCSGSSYPSQQLTWAFRGAAYSNESLASTSGPRLLWRIDNIEPGSQGVYSCVAKNPVSNETVIQSTELLVYYVPERPAKCLGVEPVDLSQLQLNCTWAGAYPTPRLRWEADRVLKAAPTEQLLLNLTRSQLLHGPTLRCMAEHPALAPGKEQLCSLTLKASDRHPDCFWERAWGPAQAQVTCSWLGLYPPPQLRWEGGLTQQVAAWKVLALTNNLTVTLNQSQLGLRERVTCTARHILSPEERSCSLNITAPYPRGDPIAAAVEASSVTLTCTEATSSPPANTTWRIGVKQEEVTPGSKYVVSAEGADVKLTILNVTMEDAGFYFCRSENAVGVVALEVHLTVKASSVNTGAIIGTFIALLIIVATFVLAKTFYSQRHQICLGGGFGQLSDGGDVLNLVDSDDEQMFQDSVPQLPPVTNGGPTTLVQIHRMPLSDHEDSEAADTSPQQLEDTAEAEEPVDLVSY
ncbi:V-set and immunoglobulin domain-containing protein 10 [Betta splendens]|uniref:V-set and immunoglobulin domain-containing protein 10 n=1 Tax=Betta splendens TaxID=158456 RepID=UPI0010F813AF|nr:V-set and immunoglobulin domain-containing protein 10 [Betta splendens]